MKRGLGIILLAVTMLVAPVASAQTPPSPAELKAYTGLLDAVAKGDMSKVKELIKQGVDLNVRDSHGRTPLMVAAHMRDRRMLTALAAAGADLNLLDNQAYDVITIASVLKDTMAVVLAVSMGGDATLITSPYEGTALIAAAHLGHVSVVRQLIKSGAPLDHVNNLGWTALIESIVLGDGGPRHVATLKELVEAGADVNLPDGEGRTPLTLARMHKFTEMERILEAAGAKP